MKFSAKTDAMSTHMNTPRSEARQQPTLKSTLRGAPKSKVKEKLSLTTAEVKHLSCCLVCIAQQPPAQQTSQGFVRLEVRRVGV